MFFCLVQLNQFRSIKAEDGSRIVINYRPIQATNGRKIFASFGDAPTDPSTSSNKTTTASGAESYAASYFAVVLISLVILVLFN